MPIDALSILCAQLTRDLLAIAKFLFTFYDHIRISEPCFFIRSLTGSDLLIDSPPHPLVNPSLSSSPLSSSITPGSKQTFSTNPFHIRLLYLLDCLRIILLFLVSHFKFLFIPCGRLSWLPVSFLLHVKIPTIVSYRIVPLVTVLLTFYRAMLCIARTTVYKDVCLSVRLSVHHAMVFYRNG